MVVIRVKLSPSELPVYITYKGNDSILTIKDKLRLQTGVPLEEQILSHSSGHLVQDSDLIGVIAEYCGKLINMNLDIGVMGGASNITSFNAPDMTSEECFEVKQFGTPGSRTILSQTRKRNQFLCVLSERELCCTQPERNYSIRDVLR